VPATCCAGGAKKWRAEHTEYLRGADVVLVPDNDEPGWRHVNEIGALLSGIAKRTRVLVLPHLPPKGDIKEWAAAGGTREQLDTLIEQAPEWQPPTVEEAAVSNENKAKATADEQKLIDELARLNAVDYDRRRNEAANQMGIRRGTLDDQVNARRAEHSDEARPPPLFGHWVVEPWPEAVGTPTLISSLGDRIKRHVVLSDDEALTVALWIMFAWVHDAAAVHSPILLVTLGGRQRREAAKRRAGHAPWVRQ
jgi:DNA primase